MPDRSKHQSMENNQGMKRCWGGSSKEAGVAERVGRGQRQLKMLSGQQGQTHREKLRGIKESPGKQEHEAWPVSISLGLLGFQRESHYLSRCPHSWQAAFRAASDFLFSWVETASKQGGFLCTSVTPLEPQGNLRKKTGGSKTLWDSTVKETINDLTWFW